MAAGQAVLMSRRLTTSRIGALALALLTGCAAPVAGLWPAAPGRPTHRIVVSVDVWHAMIALPPVAADERTGPTPPGVRFEEWGYAERGWYVEHRQGLGGVLRAMLWPSPGVVEVAWVDRLWADRTPDPPAQTFSFDLGEVGYVRLREHLASTLAGAEPVAVVGPSRFYPARGDYHLFHTCHQYAARALREAGLPMAPALALSRSALVAQLRRASRMSGQPSASRPDLRASGAEDGMRSVVRMNGPLHFILHGLGRLRVAHEALVTAGLAPADGGSVRRGGRAWSRLAADMGDPWFGDGEPRSNIDGRANERDRVQRESTR